MPEDGVLVGEHPYVLKDRGAQIMEPLHDSRARLSDQEPVEALWSDALTPSRA